MGEKGNFRTVINGFHKSDVLEYIDSLQAGYANDLRRYQQQISELHRQLDNANKQSSEWTERMEQLQNELTELQEKNLQIQQEPQEDPRYAAEIYRLTQEVEILRLEKKELLSRLSDAQANPVSAEHYEQEIRTLKDQLSRADDDMRMLSEKHGQMTEQITFLRQDNQALTSRLQDAQTQLTDVRSQLDNAQFQLQDSKRQLNDTNQQLQDARQQLNDVQSQMSSTTEKLQNASDSNRHYDSLVGDAGAFVVELYSMGQRFLETSFKRSDGCLSAMESSIASLSAQMSEALQQVKQARQELLDHGTVAGLRLDEMVQSLEQSAGISESVQHQKDSVTNE